MGQEKEGDVGLLLRPQRKSTIKLCMLLAMLVIGQ